MADVVKQWYDAPLNVKQKIQSLIFSDGYEYDMKQQNFIINKISPLYSSNITALRTNSDKNSTVVIPRRIELRLPG